MANYLNKLSGYFGLGRDINKVKSDQEETTEGVVRTLLPELELKMDDDQLTDLTKEWKKKWNESPKRAELEKKQQENEKYWLGKLRPMISFAVYYFLGGNRWNK